jgi:NADPH:quinone reductase-like Zn-dependent oxidoreductase
MKGIVNTRSGSLEALKIQDVNKPVPKPNQVLIRVKASAITNMEYMRYTKYINKGKAGGFAFLMDTAMGARGKIIGIEMSGVIEEVGRNVKYFKKGDEVFGLTASMKGAWGEYAVANEKEICIKPTNLSFEQSAAIPVGAITALGAVYAAKIQKGQQVLIQGGSGGVGQYTVQLSKAQGGIVTAVCSTKNLETARNNGADYIIDYKHEDIAKSEKKYDVIIAINGYNPLNVYKKILNKGGTYIFVGGTLKAILSVIGIPFYSIGSRKFGASAYPFLPKKKYLSDLKNLAEQGKIQPFIDKVYNPQDISEALRYIVNEHAQGKVVINLDFH